MDIEKNNKYKRAFIFTGGKVFTDLLPVFQPGICTNRTNRENVSGDIVIAADSGYDLCFSLGIEPDIVLGDMDSVKSPPGVSFGGKIIVVPSEKNDTDTMLAVKYALDAGYADIIIIGGLGGRADHTLSNIFILEYIYNRGCRGMLTDGLNRIMYLKNGSVRVEKSDYRYFSLLAADRVCRGVNVTGCKYPLCCAVLNREEQYAVSNEVLSDAAVISVDEGALFVIESRD